MKAPGTAKITTFLPFHASVEILEAIRKDVKVSKRDGDRGWTIARDRRTDTARAAVRELGGVGDVDEGARGDRVADFDAGHC